MATCQRLVERGQQGQKYAGAREAGRNRSRLARKQVAEDRERVRREPALPEVLPLPKIPSRNRAGQAGQGSKLKPFKVIGRIACWTAPGQPRGEPRKVLERSQTSLTKTLPGEPSGVCPAPVHVLSKTPLNASP